MTARSVFAFDAGPRWRSAAAAAVAALMLAQSPALAQTTPERTPPVDLVEYQEPAETPVVAAAPREGELVAPPIPVGGGPDPVPQDGFTLVEAEWIAVRFNPELRRQAAEWGAAQGRAVQAGLYPNPTIGNINPIEFAGSESIYSFGFSQDIVTGGKLKLDRAAAEQQVRQASWNYLRARLDVLYEVRSQFYVTLVAQERLERLRRVAEIAERSTDIAAQLERAGEGSRLDVLQLRIDTERARAAAHNVEQVVLGQRRQLAARMGVPLESLPPVVGDLDAPLPNYDETRALHYVMHGHAQTQVAAIDVRRNRLLLERAQVEPLPNVQVQSGYQYNAGDGVQDHPFLALYAEVPLFDRNQGNIRAARNDLSAAAARVSVTQNTLAGQMANALAQYRAASLVVERYTREILPAAREAQEAIQRGFTQGEFDLLRVMQSQRTLIDAELSYLDAQEQRWTSAATVSSLLQLERFP